MTSLQVKLLGGLEVSAEAGRILQLPTRKASFLLARLAMQPGKALAREQLTGLLWSDRGEEQARASLRQAIYSLRRALPPESQAALEVTPRTLRLRADAVWTDLDAFETSAAASERPSLEQAAALYTGDLMAGLSAPDPAFEDWLRLERARVRGLAIDALDRLVELRLAESDPTAMPAARRLVALDPLRERSWRLAIATCARLGERHAALALYRDCEETLRRELDVVPEPETRRLGEALRNGKLPLADGAPAAGTVAVAPPGPARDDRPGIAVLPFANLSPDPDQGYFVEGVIEDIVTELSRFRSLRVVAKSASFRFRDDSAPPAEIGRALGADYLLRGSVRRAGDSLRITAQLLRAECGEQVWAERYDGALEEVFDLQDRITRSVVGALPLRIDDERLGRSRRKPRENLQAYDCWLHGLHALRRGEADSEAEAERYFRQALQIDPHYARAHAGMSLIHFNEWTCRAWDQWEHRHTNAYAFAQKAVALDDTDHVTHCVLGKILLYRRQFDSARKHLDRALALNPNDADFLIQNSLAQAQLGRTKFAIELGETAMRLNPYHDDWYHAFVGACYFFDRRYRESIDNLRRAPEVATDGAAGLAVAHAYLGESDEARRWADEYLRIFTERITFGRTPEPGEPARWVLHVNPLLRAEDEEHLRHGLEMAGLSLE